MVDQLTLERILTVLASVIVSGIVARIVLKGLD